MSGREEKREAVEAGLPHDLPEAVHGVNELDAAIEQATRRHRLGRSISGPTTVTSQ